MNKKWFYLAGALALVTGLLLAIETMTGRLADKASKMAVGADFAAGSQLLEADEVIVKSAVGEVVLKKADGGAWSIGVDGFPVDAQRLARLLDQLDKAKVIDRLGSDPAIAEKTGVADGTVLAFNAGGKELARFKFGQNRAKGGQYASGSGDEVVLLSEAVMVQGDASAWELKSFLSVTGDAVREVDFRPAGGKRPVSFVYDPDKKLLQPADPIAAGLEGDALDPAAVERLANAFAHLNFSARVDQSHAEANAAVTTHPGVVKITLSDGTAFELAVGEIGREQKKYYAQVRSVVVGAAPAEASLAIRQMQDIYGKWIFEVGEGVAARLGSGAEDFKAKSPAKEEGS